MIWESDLKCNQLSIGMVVMYLQKCFEGNPFFPIFSIICCYWIAENSVCHNF